MNVVLVEKSEVNGSRIILTDYRAKHIARILQAEVGDHIRLGILGGKIGDGQITFIKKKYPFMVELSAEFHQNSPAKEPIDLLLAMPRPIMLRRILSQATALGCSTIHIVNANRVEKSFWQSGLISQSEYIDHLVTGLEQAVDTVLPKVMFHRRFKPFVEDYLPTQVHMYSHLICAHPTAEVTLGLLDFNMVKKILLAIGPEGGWVDYELRKFSGLGFRHMTAGERILKVDTAVVNLHGRIMAKINH